MSLLAAMSAQLRHSNLETTQRSYYRMEQGATGKQLKNAWKDTELNVSKSPLLTTGSNRLDMLEGGQGGI